MGYFRVLSTKCGFQYNCHKGVTPGLKKGCKCGWEKHAAGGDSKLKRNEKVTVSLKESADVMKQGSWKMALALFL